MGARGCVSRLNKEEKKIYTTRLRKRFFLVVVVGARAPYTAGCVYTLYALSSLILHKTLFALLMSLVKPHLPPSPPGRETVLTAM